MAPERKGENSRQKRILRERERQFEREGDRRLRRFGNQASDVFSSPSTQAFFPLYYAHKRLVSRIDRARLFVCRGGKCFRATLELEITSL